MEQEKQGYLKFIDYLPDFFREEEENLNQFLAPFEEVLEELRISIEGKAYETELKSIVDGCTLLLKPFSCNPLEFIGQERIQSLKSKLEADVNKIELPVNQSDDIRVYVDKWFAAGLEVGELMVIYTGKGLSDIFDPARRTLVLNQDRLEPEVHKEFKYSPQDSEFTRIKYLASWLSIPLREDKPFEWNREFLKRAIPLWNDRYTVQGLERLLTEWLRGDIEDSARVSRPVIVTDLTSKYNRFYNIFCLDKKDPPILGVNTVLGEGPPNFFIVDIVVNSRAPELRSKEKLLELFRAVRFIIDKEKPAHTYYQLRIRNSTMQLTPPIDAWQQEEIYAQTGVTTLLWEGAWVYNGY